MKKTPNYALIILLALAVCGCNGRNRTATNAGDLQPLATDSELKIIVRLKIPGIDKLMADAARLKDPQAAAEAQAQIERRINHVADRVLQRIAHTSYRLVRRYSTLPLLALTVSPAAKAILETLPDVERISLDQPRGLTYSL